MSARPAPSEWESKKAGVALSKARRAALREFANGIDPSMSKAAALYALIDTLAASRAASEDPEAQAARDFARSSAEAAARCASALERVCAALAPLDALISADASAPAPEGGQPRAALGPKEWIAGALARLGAKPARIGMALTWRSIEARARGVELRFTVSRIEIDGRALHAQGAGLPILAINDGLASALADISPATLAGGANLVCAGTGRGWKCELRAAGADAHPPLHCFQC